MRTLPLKWIIPSREMSVPILSGPFRGARVRMNPHDNLRKMFGLYEHELNNWLERVLPQVDTVLDVGANNGYFAFGCAAAFRRLDRMADIIAFEPQSDHCQQLEASLRNLKENSKVTVLVEQGMVGRNVSPGQTTLDTAAERFHLDPERRRTLIKIDVEGAELDVIAGAACWMREGNFFLIEIHSKELLEQVAAAFADRDLKLERRDQRPLPILGREQRSLDNWWLVTPLG